MNFNLFFNRKILWLTVVGVLLLSTIQIVYASAAQTYSYNNGYVYLYGHTHNQENVGSSYRHKANTNGHTNNGLFQYLRTNIESFDVGTTGVCNQRSATTGNVYNVGSAPQVSTAFTSTNTCSGTSSNPHYYYGHSAHHWHTFIRGTVDDSRQ